MFKKAALYPYSLHQGKDMFAADTPALEFRRFAESEKSRSSGSLLQYKENLGC
jgi:hypothetical protein